MKDLLHAELGAIHAEMARNNAELLGTIRSDMARQRGAIRNEMADNNPELLATRRAEMTPDHDDLVAKLAEFDSRIGRLEVKQ